MAKYLYYHLMSAAEAEECHHWTAVSVKVFERHYDFQRWMEDQTRPGYFTMIYDGFKKWEARISDADLAFETKMRWG